jgi:hypothetical protein
LRINVVLYISGTEGDIVRNQTRMLVTAKLSRVKKEEIKKLARAAL